MEEMEKPFLDETNELLVLNSKDSASADVMRSVRTTEKPGQDPYHAFVHERLTRKRKYVFDPIIYSDLHIFSHLTSNSISNSKIQVA